MPPRSVPSENKITSCSNGNSVQHDPASSNESTLALRRTGVPGIRCKRCRARLMCNFKIIKDHLQQCISLALMQGEEIVLSSRSTVVNVRDASLSQNERKKERRAAVAELQCSSAAAAAREAIDLRNSFRFGARACSSSYESANCVLYVCASDNPLDNLKKATQPAARPIFFQGKSYNPVPFARRESTAAVAPARATSATAIMRKFTVNKDILVNKFKLRLYCKNDSSQQPRSDLEIGQRINPLRPLPLREKSHGAGECSSGH
ncbi:unnamed protein product [Trichogramma brassicae]|uniref:Uncharacterized protein n=1 Tax=Trichogramma brassicae TaxID=86971 RepID=A0A6H5HUS9_9HYME|nr:unnamed protein product [Trichogramma brassicae]